MDELELARKIILWIGKNAEKDYANLYTRQETRWLVDAKDLLDLLHKECDISVKEINTWLEEGERKDG